MSKEEYTERVEIVPCDDDWPGYEETMAELLKFYELQKDMSAQIEVKLGWKAIFLPWIDRAAYNREKLLSKKR